MNGCLLSLQLGHSTFLNTMLAVSEDVLGILNLMVVLLCIVISERFKLVLFFMILFIAGIKWLNRLPIGLLSANFWGNKVPVVNGKTTVYNNDNANFEDQKHSGEAAWSHVFEVHTEHCALHIVVSLSSQGSYKCYGIKEN